VREANETQSLSSYSVYPLFKLLPQKICKQNEPTNNEKKCFTVALVVPYFISMSYDNVTNAHWYG